MSGRNLIEAGPLAGLSRYEMPKPCLGQTVLWSYNPGSAPSPAVVTKVGHDSIAVNIHVDSLKDHLLKNGVRHTTDPWLAKFPAHDGGCWDFTIWDKMLMEHLRLGVDWQERFGGDHPEE
jgi:hypothetical protein